MKKYIVLHSFRDLVTDGTVRLKGDVYDAESLGPSDRVEELENFANAFGRPMIAAIEVRELSDYPIAKGGGYYLASDGTTVKGKDNAAKLQKELNNNDD